MTTCIQSCARHHSSNKHETTNNKEKILSKTELETESKLILKERINYRDQQMENLKNKLKNNKNNIPRCLFGKPEPEDTRQLLNDSLNIELNRFIGIFGLDPVTLLNKLNETQCQKSTIRKRTRSTCSRQAKIHRKYTISFFLRVI